MSVYSHTRTDCHREQQIVQANFLETTRSNYVSNVLQETKDNK